MRIESLCEKETERRMNEEREPNGELGDGSKLDL